MTIQEVQQQRKLFVTGSGYVVPGYPADQNGPAERSHELRHVQTRRVDNVGAAELIDAGTLRRMDRFSQMAMVAAELAVRNSNVQVTPENTERTGIIFNSCFGPLDITEQYVSKILKEGSRRAPAGLFPFTALNVFTGLITMRLKLHGTNSTLCGSSAMSYAVNALRQWTDDRVLAGGVEELTDSMVSGFNHRLRGETGLGSAGAALLGEAAAVVVIEGQTSAASMPANAQAQVHGFGSACSYQEQSPFAIEPEAILDAMQEALTNSGLYAADIDLFVCAGNAFDELEENELAAARVLFPLDALPEAINPKLQYGEVMGASEVLSIAVASSALQQQQTPKGMRLHGLDWTPTRASSGYRYALVNAIEFGGAITSYVLSRVNAGN